MHTRTATVRARIEPEVKAEAEAVLARLGLSASDAIRMLFHQVKETRSLPLQEGLQLSPAVEASAKQLEAGGTTRYKSADALFEAWDTEDAAHGK